MDLVLDAPKIVMLEGVQLASAESKPLLQMFFAFYGGDDLGQMIDDELEMKLANALRPKSVRQPLSFVFASEYLGVSDHHAEDRESRGDAAQHSSSAQVLRRPPLGELFHERHRGAHTQAQEAE
jgi:hypothetical protein